jgi:outer membrane murein-binding lipoprotein Lpp
MPKAVRRILDVDPKGEMEVSFVRRGSNPHAKVFLKKSADTPSEQPENQNMLKAQLLKSILLAGGAAAAYVDTLTDESALNAHLEKSETDRQTEVAAWVEKSGFGKAKEGEKTGEKTMKAEDIAAIVKSAVDAAVAPLQKSLDDTSAELAAVKKAGETVSLQKRAETEFKGLGVGVEKTVAVLKAAQGLGQDERETIETVFRAHAEMCRMNAAAVGHASLLKNESSATARLEKMASERAEKNGEDYAIAFGAVCADPANAELVAKADAEEADIRADAGV